MALISEVSNVEEQERMKSQEGERSDPAKATTETGTTAMVDDVRVGISKNGSIWQSNLKAENMINTMPNFSWSEGNVGKVEPVTREESKEAAAGGRGGKQEEGAKAGRLGHVAVTKANGSNQLHEQQILDCNRNAIQGFYSIKQQQGQQYQMEGLLGEHEDQLHSCISLAVLRDCAMLRAQWARKKNLWSDVRLYATKALQCIEAMERFATEYHHTKDQSSDIAGIPDGTANNQNQYQLWRFFFDQSDLISASALGYVGYSLMRQNKHEEAIVHLEQPRSRFASLLPSTTQFVKEDILAEVVEKSLQFCYQKVTPSPLLSANTNDDDRGRRKFETMILKQPPPPPRRRSIKLAVDARRGTSLSSALKTDATRSRRHIALDERYLELCPPREKLASLVGKYNASQRRQPYPLLGLACILLIFTTALVGCTVVLTSYINSQRRQQPLLTIPLVEPNHSPTKAHRFY